MLFEGGSCTFHLQTLSDVAAVAVLRAVVRAVLRGVLGAVLVVLFMVVLRLPGPRTLTSCFVVERLAFCFARLTPGLFPVV